MGHAREWWHYAVNSVRQNQHALQQMWSGDRLRRLGLDRREYVRIWYTIKAGRPLDGETLTVCVTCR